MFAQQGSGSQPPSVRSAGLFAPSSPWACCGAAIRWKQCLCLSWCYSSLGSPASSSLWRPRAEKWTESTHGGGSSAHLGIQMGLWFILILYKHNSTTSATSLAGMQRGVNRSYNNYEKELAMSNICNRIILIELPHHQSAGK